ncbi:MAG: NAD(P) transhydrogenase subunit alpha [Bacteroidetes bacterium]|nr:NAD(P) transhydrogenase subunit alpha [Bacteroidota bacterium]MBP6315683.1 NAD(P) transhydrogenase subunit alpha [Chitinophagaceae bacterium]
MDSMLDFFSANYNMITIVILSIFLGIEVISRVPSVLHTPLMSGANAIHGVVIIGAIIVMGQAEDDNYLALLLGFLAVILGTLNVVGGFVVTDRMLEMFKKKPKK